MNTPGAEILYSAVVEELQCRAQETQSSACILDICCGTGTIGIVTAKKLSQQTATAIVGIDNCAAAIENAQFNSSLNDVQPVQETIAPGVTTAAFVCCRAEAILEDVLGGKPATTAVASTSPMLAQVQRQLSNGDYAQVYAVVDPPREVRKGNQSIASANLRMRIGFASKLFASDSQLRTNPATCLCVL